MQPIRLLKFGAVVLLLAVLTAGSSLAQRGSADFTRYVAIGDSLTAGYADNSLIDVHQRWSYPAVIARQARAGSFEQPLISDPGIPGELVLQSLSPVTLVNKPGNGNPLNLNLPRPYNNLGIPGARVADILTRTGAEPAAGNPYYQIILRGQGTAVAQALALQPTFISVWIGNNDVLGAVTAGTPAALTPLADFQRDYARVLDTLIAGAPNAGIITANIPDVTAIAFANTVAPVMVNPATNQPVPGPGGQPIFLYADLGGGNLGQLPPGSLVTLGATSFLATGYGIPPALAPNFPNLPNAGRPLPDAVVLTPTELATIRQRHQEVNAAIAAAASQRNIPVVDIAAMLNEFRGGRNYAGVTLSLAFLTGGIFSYDGVHPTDIGYTLVANEFIKRINAAWGARIPLASLLPFFSNNTPPSLSGVLPLEPQSILLDPAAWQNLVSLFAGGGATESPLPPDAGRRSRR
jgi:lysophospholipase L1-like esterase